MSGPVGMPGIWDHEYFRTWDSLSKDFCVAGIGDGITAVRLTSKGRLQVAYSQVCTLNGGAYKTKALREIIAPIRLGCCTYLRPMGHNVPSENKLERIAT